ncbi:MULTISPECIES: hypothetical protein [unclassified Streptomyces]|uniref:hypothetical protein n=1 Tax=unclassified Streptomyces TaxID=2593676 RepID=UPI003429441B
MALAKLFGPDAQRRLEHASALDAACLSGLALLLFGGAWLPPAGSTAKENPAALGVAALGLAVFFAGILAQLSIGIFGGPRFLLPRHFRGAKSDVSAVSMPVPGRAGDTAEISADRDEAES